MINFTVELKNIIQKALFNELLTKDECKFILDYPNDKIEELVNEVYKVRYKYKGNKVSVQILTNAKSGNCSQNCKYCAQSCISKANIDKYSLIDFDKLLENGKTGDNKNVKRHCVGFSGLTFTDEQIDKICEYFKKLKNEVKTDICCSIGFLTKEQAIKLHNSGVSRINHNLNTSRRNYPNICTTHTYQQRIDNIKMLKEVGFEMCCGGIIGVGENQDDIVDMLYDIREINPKSVPINFLIPIKGTPFENNAKDLTPEYCLKVLSLARLLIPQADVRCAAGREIHIKEKQPLMLKIVNSIFASGYLTADGQNIEDTKKLIENSGFEYESC